jgi:K+-sensing histidine kinase KdpD
VRIDRDRLRLYALAFLAGAIAEGGLVLAIHVSETDSLAILFFLEAVILGLVFGARPGMVAAVVPLIALYPIALIVDDIAQPIAVLSYLIFVVIVLAFFAGMAGALRDRYGGRSIPPPTA